MAVSMLDNIGYKGQKPDNLRSQFNSIAEMVAYSENYLPSIYVTLCAETGKQYMYQRSNSVDTTLGKWREITVGGSSIDTYTKTEIDNKDTDIKDDLGDVSTLFNTELHNAISAINFVYGVGAGDFDYSDKKIIITLRNGGTKDIDCSPIITDTSIDEFKNVNIADLVTGQFLGYDGATSKWVNKTIDLDAVLQSAKDYTDEEITKSEQENAIGCDEKPTKSGDTITYKQNGEEKTTTDTGKWFYYTSGTGIAQTRWIDDIEYNIDLGAVNLSDYVTVNRVTNTIEDTDKTKIPTLTAVSEVYAKVNEELGKKVNTSDIVDNLLSESTDKPLSANQGKVIQTELNKKLSIAQTVADAGKIVKVDTDGNLVLGDTTGSSENISYENTEHSAWTNVKKALDGIITQLYYVKPSITSFVANPATTVYEIGQKISSITFTWETNKDITTQSLTDCTLADATVRTATYDTEISSNKTFTLSIGDGENIDSQTFSVAFRNKIYYGGATLPTNFDSAFVLGLPDSQFATTKNDSYSMTVGSGEYGFIAYPKSFGQISSVYIGGLETTVENCGDISFTNASGGVETYNIVRTGRSGLGSITMEVR